MTRLFCILLALLISLSGPVMGKNSDFGRWGIAEKTVAVAGLVTKKVAPKSTPTDVMRHR
jgi:hypothetical protein